MQLGSSGGQQGFTSTTSAPVNRCDKSKSIWSKPISRSRQRGLASAALPEVSLTEEYIPFDTSQPKDHIRSPFYSIPLQHPPPPTESRNTPLILPESFSTIPTQFKSTKGISTDLSDIHQTLYACLRVGRLERAATLLKRLNSIYKPNAPGLLAAHNAYIREIVYRLDQDDSPKLLEHVQRWFAVQMEGMGVQGDVSTFASMIHASLYEANGKKRQRSVARYVALANEAGIQDETILTASENCSEEDTQLLNELASRESRPDSIINTSSADETSHRAAENTKPLPQVLPAQLKGLGLSTLQRTLIPVDAMAIEELGSSPGTPMSSKERTVQVQRLLERNTLALALERWRDEDAENKKLGINSALAGGSLGSLMWEWHEQLLPRIKEEIQEVNRTENKRNLNPEAYDRCLYGPFLQYISPQKLAAAVILSTMTIMSSSTGKPDRTGNCKATKLVGLAKRVGETIQEESIIENQHDLQHRHAKAQYKQVSSKGKKHSLQLLRKLVRYGRPPQDLQWSVETKVRIGTALLSHLFDVAKIRVALKDAATNDQTVDEQSAFLHAISYTEGRKNGIVRFHPALLEKLIKEPSPPLLAKNLPMLAEPNPWTGYRDGGFLEQRHTVARMKDEDAQSRRYIEVAARNGDLNQLFEGLNVLGKTSWTVNRSVFEVMLEAWNSGEAIAKMPSHDPTVEFPPEPAESATNAERAQWSAEVRRVENQISGLKTQRCFQNFQVEVARSYLGKTFYFPHNIDFRGRAYPMTPLFNQMGADNVRGLLLFAEGKALGAAGLRWLKVHLANVFGFDKASLSEREAFAMEHWQDIQDSIKSPLQGNRWWLKAEDPWQCLATCMELHNALTLENPEKYVSHLPIHQDGTCNGLQHYAALGGDPIGAKEVNLEPGDRPADIYSAVAQSVKADIEEDAAAGVELAKLLSGRITRKIVKQTVMTNVYGVTFVGARRQVQKQLKDHYDDLVQKGPLSYATASAYIARKIFKALSAMFEGAHDIQYWFGNCASRICQSLAPQQIEKLKKAATGEHEASPYKTKSVGRPKDDPLSAFRTPVIWTSPLRLPVVQPYKKLTSRSVRTHLQRISLSSSSSFDPINKARQLQAFPPNFIHSLDATHMVLTAIKCNKLGLTFSAVHDSFWTHAADIDTMNVVIRDAFIKLHSENVIERLAAEFATRYQGYMYLAPIKRQSTVGKEISALRKASTSKTGDQKAENPRSKKVVSRKRQEELLQELRRLELLSSESPEERQRGEAMVTPGSIVTNMAKDSDMPTTEDLGHAALGQIPMNQDAPEATLDGTEPADMDDEADHNPTVNESDADVGYDPATAGKRRKNQKRPPAVYHVWLPLTFPDVPKKVRILDAIFIHAC